MAGIYIHIPFCKQACYYCNFHFSTSRGNNHEMVEALLREIVLQKDFFAGTGDTISSIYLGGGTPSLLEIAEIASLMGSLRKHFRVAEDAEVTLEANPDDISPANLQLWKRSGINRLSIGVQSFFDEDLRSLNRAHNAAQALTSLQQAQEAGFGNMSADLIYGIPGLSDERWQENIGRMTALGLPHLSCYALTVEPHTALDHMIRTGKYPAVGDAQAARQFGQLTAILETAGYEHYEISNFALPGRRSQHNSSYWQGKPYLGIGPSAHSFTGESRQWNVASNAGYVKSIRDGEVPFTREILTPSMQLNEYIMTSLRTMEGCDLGQVEERWGREQRDRLRLESQKFIGQGQIRAEGNILVLTGQGKLFADGIAAALFI
jgi:oxygen-independent coproporphyrinogen-3 oxidase